MLVVRVSGQASELYSGLPVDLSQRVVVSRWLVRPTAARSESEWPLVMKTLTASSMHVSTLESSSAGSCSCHL